MIRKDAAILSRKPTTPATPEVKTESRKPTVRRGKFTPRSSGTGITTNSGNKSKYKNLKNARHAGKFTALAPINDVSSSTGLIPLTIADSSFLIGGNFNSVMM